MSKTGVLCVRKEGFVCQKQGFRVSEKRVSCVRNKGFVCQKQGFRVSENEFRVSEMTCIFTSNRLKSIKFVKTDKGI